MIDFLSFTKRSVVMSRVVHFEIPADDPGRAVGKGARPCHCCLTELGEILGAQ